MPSSSHECITTASGEDYIGHVNHTVSGIPCQRWISKSPHDHSYDDILYFADYSSNPEAMVQDVANYCRNPAGLTSADVMAWCFTSEDNVDKEFCDIPRCKSKLVFTVCH